MNKAKALLKKARWGMRGTDKITKLWVRITAGLLVVILIVSLVFVFLPREMTITSKGGVAISNYIAMATSDVKRQEQFDLYTIGQEIVEKRTRTSKTTYLGNNAYALDASIGVVHYKDTSDNWQNINSEFVESVAPWDWEMSEAGYGVKVLEDFTAGQIIEFSKGGENVAFQPMALEWTNDIDQISQISMPQNVAPTITNVSVELLPNVVSSQGIIEWLDGYGSGIDFQYKATASRLQKILTVSGVSDLPPPQQYIIDGGNPVLRLNFIFDPSSGTDIYVNGLVWNKTSTVTTGSYVEFRKGGETLWGFTPLRYWDSGGSEGQSIATLEKRGNSLYISIRVSYSWLQTAIYPVFIDPTIDVQVDVSANDGYVREPGGGFYSSFSLAYAGNEDIAATQYTEDSWYRFTGITIPQNSTISTANVSLNSSSSAGSPLTNIYADDQNDPTAPTSNADYDNRTSTTASVAWDTAPSNGWADSPSIVSIIQELVDSYDYSNEAIQILHKDDGSGAGNNYIRCLTYDSGDGSSAPKLYIEYTAVGNPYFVRATEGSIDDSSLTLSIESSGDDRVLVMGLAYKSNNPLTPTSIVFNTTENFTIELVGTDAADAQAFLAYLAAPTVTTANMTVIMPSSVRMVGYVALFTGVDQTDPFTDSSNETQGSTAGASVNVSSAIDEIVIDVIAQVSAGPDTIDANSGILIMNGAATGGGSDTRGGGQYSAGNTTIEMSYTFSSTDDWNLVAGSLQPVSEVSANISNTPASVDFGIVNESSTYYSNGSAPTFPLDAGECLFTVTNNSGASVDITISSTNFTGGVGWSISGSVGEDIVVLDAGKVGDNSTDMITLTGSEQSFITSLADAGTEDWELRLETGTYTDGVVKNTTVTLTASIP